MGLHPLVRLMGLYSPTPSPVPPNNLVLEEGKKGVLIPLVEQCYECYDPLGREEL